MREDRRCLNCVKTVCRKHLFSVCSGLVGNTCIPTSWILRLTQLYRLDVLRGFSGAEKLTYSEEVRQCVASNASLHTLVGCPPIIFQRIGDVIASAKQHLEGRLSTAQFQSTLEDAESFLRGIDLDKVDYPTEHSEWKQLAEAYRHACLLRTMRWPDTFGTPCEDDRIKASVSAILDSCANVSMGSPFYKRLLFPLFLAAVDTSVGHQIHYAGLCIDDIRRSTGFGHSAMMEVLEGVWKERRRNPGSHLNVPWMEFVSKSEITKLNSGDTDLRADLL